MLARGGAAERRVFARIMRAVRTRPLIALSLLLGACWAGDPDIMALLLHLKFEPHHRNFVKNLYDKQMLVSRRPPRSPAIISRQKTPA